MAATHELTVEDEAATSPHRDRSTTMPDLPEEITWTLINTEDWGGGLERTYRAENVEHANCGGDVHLIHLHDEAEAITGAHSRCAKCGEDLTP